jgi:hypothetical protein
MRHGSSMSALVGSLLLLAASVTLLVLGPTLLARFQGSADSMPAGNYLNIAAASGIALGGGAAMIAVISRLVRDLELRPYAGLAPVLAVFAGFVVWGLRAQLPLQGVSAEYVGLFALALSVAGGALIVQSGAMARMAGWALAFFAPVTLLLMLWGSSGQKDLGTALASFPQPTKVYLMLLGATGLTLAILGEVAGLLRRRQLWKTADDEDQDEPVLSLGSARDGARSAGSSLPPLAPRLAPALRSSRPLTGPAASAEPERILPTPHYTAQSTADLPNTANLWRTGSASASAKPQSASAAEYDAYLLQSYMGQQRNPGAASASVRSYTTEGYTPKVSVWDFEDEPLTLPKKSYWWRVLLLLLVLVGGGGAALYYGVMLPKRQKEQAALQQLNQRKAEIQAAEEREAQAQRDADSKAAAERLEQMLNAPAPAEAEQAAPSMAGAAAIPPAPKPARP